MTRQLRRRSSRGLWRRASLHLRPYSGRLWLDCLLVLVVAALDTSILPSMFGSLTNIDLMTPWLVTALVHAPLPSGALLAGLGALLMEAHGSAPAGLYLVAYWLIAVLIYLCRSTLSWRHAFPWLVTYGIAEVWVTGFEAFVLTVKAGSLPGDFGFFARAVAQILLAVGIGALLCRRSLTDGLPVGVT